MVRYPPRGGPAVSGERSAAGRRRGGIRLPYMPGLDGLRALALIAVLLYHAGIPWMPGGFLGVEVFFVLSGYLITALLLSEWRTKGSVDLKGFWLRRARRLLPALYVLIVVTLAYSVVFLPEEVAGLRADAVAAFGYVTNWYLVIGQESYFEAVGRPSLLKHLWSLAVEEQFYLFWPVVFWVGISFGATRWRQRRVLVSALGVAALSILLMAIMYAPGVDPSRLYYGTDTRAAGLLIGAALAFVWVPGHGLVSGGDRDGASRGLRGAFRRRWGWTAPLLLDVTGLAALGGLVWFCLSIGEYGPFLYRGGFPVVALTTAVLIMALVHPHARLGGPALLGWLPLRWIGERSYGIYLWHWPVYMITRPQLDVALDGLPLLALRLIATLALADLSYRFVETPIRKGALGRSWKALRQARGFERWDLGVRLAGAVVPVVASCVVLGVAVAQASPPEAPSYLSTKTVHIEAQNPPPGPGESAEHADSGAGRNMGAALSSPEPGESRGGMGLPGGAAEEKSRPKAEHATDGKRGREAPAASQDDSGAEPGEVVAVGDSAMLGAVDELQREVENLSIIDARVSRQIPEAIGVLRKLRAADKLGDVVIVHIGNNGVFAREQFDEMMDVLGNKRKVLVVNVTLPDGRSRLPNNEVLADGARRYPDRAALVDWYAASAGHPEYFWDGIHLTPRGARAYADLISAARDEQEG